MNWRISTWFPNLDTQVDTQLREYSALINQWNPKINLISPKTMDDLDRLHMADSILGSQVIQTHLSSQDTHEIFDLGSGNGFPGVVFAVLNPEISVNAVEVDQRKASFLIQVKIKLGLKNFSVLNSRVEDLKVSDSFVGMCRAFASIADTLSLVRDYSASKVSIYHFKGPKGQQELGELDIQKRSTWNIRVLSRYFLPSQSSQMDIQTSQTDQNHADNPHFRQIILTTLTTRPLSKPD